MLFRVARTVFRASAGPLLNLATKRLGSDTWQLHGARGFCLDQSAILSSALSKSSYEAPPVLSDKSRETPLGSRRYEVYAHLDLLQSDIGYLRNYIKDLCRDIINPTMADMARRFKFARGWRCQRVFHLGRVRLPVSPRASFRAIQGKGRFNSVIEARGLPEHLAGGTVPGFVSPLRAAYFGPFSTNR